MSGARCSPSCTKSRPLFDLHSILTDIFRSESPIVAKLQYGMKITFIFILILFIDSVNRVYRVQVELAESKDMGGYVAYFLNRSTSFFTGLIRVAERQFWAMSAWKSKLASSIRNETCISVVSLSFFH